MLRARACTEQGNPFVCAVCRHKLSRSGQPQARTFSGLPRPAGPSRNAQRVAAPRSSECYARPFSTTSTVCNANNKGGPPRLGGSLGGFPGLGKGKFGAFAADANKPAGQATPTDGLLPHEREARAKAAASQPPPKPASVARPPPAPAPAPAPRPASRFDDSAESQRPSLFGSSDSRGGNRSATDATQSSPGLSDIFSTERKPRTPPTPSSWSSGNHQGNGRSSLTQGSSRNRGSGLVDTSSKPEARPVPGWGDLGIRSSTPSTSTDAAAQAQPPKPSPGASTTGWGAFSTRKVDTEEAALAESSAQAKQPRRMEMPPLNKRSAIEDNNFWNDLETKVAGFKPPSQYGGTWQDQQSSSVWNGEIPSLQDEGVEPSREKMTLSSRFESGQPQQMSKRAQRQRSRGGRGSKHMEDEWDEESEHRWEQKRARKAEKQAYEQQKTEQQHRVIPIHLPEYISVANLAKAIKQASGSFLNDLEEMGFENITEDTLMTGETAALVVQEYGFEPTVDSGSTRDLRPRPPPEDVTSLPSRPPVVTIMGHVDHGKTTLLDWLRKSSVAAQEHGGITQHIGAFIVKMSSGSPITFLDTPGHAAFLSMRQRGANVTDIVVLVVAADDSVMPQTLEALKHATAAKVPIIVAISKIDKEDARVDQVKADLSRHGVQIEDFGGDVQVVGVSGRTGQGMNDLEENIIALADMLDVRSETDGMSEGWILESSIKPDGKVATVLVKRGTLRPGNFVVAGKTWARIRLLRNEAGVVLKEAPPGTPVEIFGWNDLPAAGEQVLQSPDEKTAKVAVGYRQDMADREDSSIQLAEQEQRQREKAAADAAAKEAEAMGYDASDEVAEPGIIYQNFTVKADVAGSVEAVVASILELGNHEVRPRILQSKTGQVTESDVDHAAASGAVIVNFNSSLMPRIKRRAEEAKVRIMDHSVIYHVIDNVKSALEKLLPELVTPHVLGEADILQTFDINTKKKVFQTIAGCKVRNGTIKKSSLVKVLRKGEVIYDGKIDTLKNVKKDVNEMSKGSECGIGLDNFQDFRVDDQIQTYEIKHEKRHF